MDKKNQMQVDIVKKLIDSYFAIVKKNVADLIPKTVMAFLVNQSKQMALSELIKEIYR